MILYNHRKDTGSALNPELIEGDIFRTVISVPEYGADPAKKYDIVQVGPDSGAQSEAQVGTQLGERLGETEKKILALIAGDETA